MNEKEKRFREELEFINISKNNSNHRKSISNNSPRRTVDKNYKDSTGKLKKIRKIAATVGLSALLVGGSAFAYNTMANNENNQLATMEMAISNGMSTDDLGISDEDYENFANLKDTIDNATTTEELVSAAKSLATLSISIGHNKIADVYDLDADQIVFDYNPDDGDGPRIRILVSSEGDTTLGQMEEIASKRPEEVSNLISNIGNLQTELLSNSENINKEALLDRYDTISELLSCKYYLDENGDLQVEKVTVADLESSDKSLDDDGR